MVPFLNPKINVKLTPNSYVPKYALWTAFNATQAAFIAPLIAFAPGPLIARAGLYTVAMMGAISFVGATAKQEKYMYIGGPLLAGAAIVAVSGLAPLVIPATAVRTLAFTENIWLYGGLAVLVASRCTMSRRFSTTRVWLSGVLSRRILSTRVSRSSWTS